MGIDLVVLLDEDKALNVEVNESRAAGFAGAAVKEDEASLGVEEEESDISGWASADTLVVDDAAVRQIVVTSGVPGRDFRDDPVREGANGWGGVDFLVLRGVEDVLDVEMVGEVIGVNARSSERSCSGFGVSSEIPTRCELVGLLEADNIAPLEERERDIVGDRGRLIRFYHASALVARKKQPTRQPYEPQIEEAILPQPIRSRIIFEDEEHELLSEAGYENS